MQPKLHPTRSGPADNNHCVKRKLRLRPYAGIRISSRGVRPLAGIGCAVPLFLTVVVSTVLGCARKPQSPPTALLIAIDTSGSARPDLATYVHVATQAVVPMVPDRDHLVIVRFDKFSTELFDETRPKLLESFELRLVQDLREVPPAGTSPAAALERLAEASRRTSGFDRKVILLLTDGGIDDRSANARNRAHAAAATLAQDDSLRRIIVAGVRPGQREGIRELFSPLAAKLVLCDLSSVQQEVRR
jgi:hypothetical protein